ncbi:MAG: glycosyltransferase [Tabrizicola sp.]
MPRETTNPWLVPLLSVPERRWLQLLTGLWIAAALWFWIWWLNPSHVDGSAGWVGWLKFGIVSLLIAWITFLQAFFLAFAHRAVRSAAPDPAHLGLRVAMIVTKTPSEPFDVVRRTLEAMLAQDIPHDTWLADENPSRTTLAWCAARGVRVSTRHGVKDYHRPTWPRRTRCKEGNLAYFYDHWGYANYDVVCQLDADHVPQPGYLREMLRPFADPEVGYVSAPSICSSNAPLNWAARTRLHTEGGFHGILQAGYSNGFAPMCIGSHYAVRTKALREVGGLGPELAEDHSTTMILNAGGWKGVHAIDAIAIGDGPATVADMVTQEFQWSRSLVTLLLQHTPRYLPSLPPRLRAQFLFCQLLYPLIALTFCAMYLLPIVAVIFDIRYSAVTYPDYFGHVLPMIFVMLAIAWSLHGMGHFRPIDASVISWERILFLGLQWPWVLWGCIMAIRDTVTGRFVDFRITPKGEASRSRLPIRVLLVYAALALGCILPVLFGPHLTEAKGFYLLTLLSGTLYVSVVLVTIWHHLSENGWTFFGTRADAGLQMAMTVLLVGLTFAAYSSRSAEGAYGITQGLERIRLVQMQTRVAGAGSGQAGLADYRFTFELVRPLSGLN